MSIASFSSLQVSCCGWRVLGGGPLKRPYHVKGRGAGNTRHGAYNFSRQVVINNLGGMGPSRGPPELRWLGAAVHRSEPLDVAPRDGSKRGIDGPKRCRGGGTCAVVGMGFVRFV